MTNLHLDCSCHSAEHIVRFEEGWPDDPEEAAFISIQLNQYYTLWDRIKAGVRYIFTGIGTVGWDTFIVKKKDIPVLVAFLQAQYDKKPDVENPGG